jgi:predicted glutamine amidotransferase
VCRMIAAVGSFRSAAVRRALLCMADNTNPTYDHEYRSRGDGFRHVDGWGASWVQNQRLHTLRRAVSVLADDTSALIDPLSTPLLVLHARKATRPNGVREANTHPFTATLAGRDWSFCHNGAIDDVDGLHQARGLAPSGDSDSERLFHHFLFALAESVRSTEGVGGPPAAPESPPGPAGETAGREVFEAALAATISVPHDFTAVHCLAASHDRVVAASCRHPERSRPAYHALWIGEGRDLRAVSSEPVDGLGCQWRRLPEPGVVTMEVQ